MKRLLFIILVACGLFINHPMQAQDSTSYHARIALNGGWTIRTSRAPMDNIPAYRDYLENVKQGLSASGNMQLFIKNLFCIGVNYDYFRKHSAAYIPLYNVPYSITLDINNTYSMDFLAFSLGIHVNEGRHHYLFQYLIGFMDYKEEGNYSPYLSVLDYNYSVGHCFGQGAMLNYDFLINKHLAFGAEITYFIGSINELTHQYTSTSQVTSLRDPIRLHRLSPKIGIRYYL